MGTWFFFRANNTRFLFARSDAVLIHVDVLVITGMDCAWYDMDCGQWLVGLHNPSQQRAAKAGREAEKRPANGAAGAQGALGVGKVAGDCW